VTNAPSGPDAGRSRRKQLGAWYTPQFLVDHIADQVLARLGQGSGDPRAVVRVLDPSCGDGRLLAALQQRSVGEVAVTGVDVDAEALAAARRQLGSGAELIHADALTFDWGERSFDVVVGNPPFLSQMAATTSRGRRSGHGGGVYADAAVEFLAMSVRLASERGGQVALVLPASLLSTRDAGPVRARLLDMGALEWFWWSPGLEFADANVRTCVFGWVRGSTAPSVTRSIGSEVQPVAPVGSDVLVGRSSTWAALIADQLGVPSLPPGWTARRRVGEIAVANANFRDEYYGLIGAVAEASSGQRAAGLASRTDSGNSLAFGIESFADCDTAGGSGSDDVQGSLWPAEPGGADEGFAPLITSGLIDPGRCHWGAIPVRFAKEPFIAPVVDLRRLSPKMQRWARRKRVPKVLLANQTRVIEAVVDRSGHWLPSVPVINVRPRQSGDLWRLAAALSNPVTSSIAASQSLGAGLSAAAIRLSAPRVELLPLPGSSPAALAAWDDAAALFAAGEIVASGLAMLDAYVIDAPEVAAWWCAEIRRRIPPVERDVAQPRVQGGDGLTAPGAVNTS
jgi:SAM-dependent methyltransferase